MGDSYRQQVCDRYIWSSHEELLPLEEDPLSDSLPSLLFVELELLLLPLSSSELSLEESSLEEESLLLSSSLLELELELVLAFLLL